MIWGWLGFILWLFSMGPNFFMLGKRSKSTAMKIKINPDQLPTLSVIVPACNEEKKISECLTSLVNSDYPNLEIITVNDRSTDGTGGVMDALSEKHSNLKVIHNKALPEGWLGKNHAMHLAQQESNSDYLLFTDGDIIFEPDAIRLAMNYSLDNNLDHLCLLPEMVAKSFLEKALGSCFGFLFFAGSFIWLIPTPVKFAYAGIGAFNLIKKTTYETIGGFQTIKMDVLDDVKIGKLVKREGFKQDFLNGLGMIRVRWQESAWKVITGLEKNGFAALEYSLNKLFMMTTALFAFFIFPYLAVFIFHDARAYGFWAILIFVHSAYLFYTVILGVDWKTLFVFPVVLLLMLFAFWRSAIITLKNGGISWRNTFYSLKELKKNVYR